MVGPLGKARWVPAGGDIGLPGSISVEPARLAARVELVLALQCEHHLRVRRPAQPRLQLRHLAPEPLVARRREDDQ